MDLVQLNDPGREETPPRLREDLRQRRPRAAAATEFGAALTALGIKQRSAAQWFRTSERNIRRWKNGTRKTPPGVMVTVRLMMAGKVGPADVELAATSAAEVELAAVPAPVQANGHATPRLVGPELEPEPAPEPPALTAAAAQVLALTANGCHGRLLGLGPWDVNPLDSLALDVPELAAGPDDPCVQSWARAVELRCALVRAHIGQLRGRGAVRAVK